MLTRFHIAVPVNDLERARQFYRGTLGCPEGRSSSHWLDFDLFGHQIVAHLKPSSEGWQGQHDPVDGHDVPTPHSGVVLTLDQWESLAERLREIGERATMFFLDPAGNALEFKAFVDFSQLFAKEFSGIG